MVTPGAVQQIQISRRHRRAAIEEILEGERSLLAAHLGACTDAEIIRYLNHHVPGGWPAFLLARAEADAVLEDVTAL